MNVIAQLEYELAYDDSTVHRFNHYTIDFNVTSRVILCVEIRKLRSLNVHIYIFCAVVSWEGFFCTWLYNIKYSNPIQIICSQLLVFKQILIIILSKSLISSIWIIEEQPLRERVDLGVMVMKEYSNTLQSSRTRTWPSDAVKCHTPDIPF